MSNEESRKAFEAWAEDLGTLIVASRQERYMSGATRRAWTAWQASRKQALEEAAQVSEQGFKFAHSGYEIADSIRRLK